MKKTISDGISYLDNCFQKHSGWFSVLLVLVTLIRLFIGIDRGLQECFYPHDDLLYLRLAHNIANGEWLGEFNSLTLGKSCIFPCFIALSILSGLPYLLFVDLAVCGTAFLGLLAFRPRLNRFWSLLLYLFFVFNPAYFFYQRLVIQDLFASLILCMTFCIASCWIRRDSSLKTIIPWIVGAGLFFALAAHTREESMVFLAVFLGVYFLLLLDALYRKESWKKIIAYASFYLLIPLFLYGCLNITIRIQNYRYYGISETCIRHNYDYKRFIGSLLGAAKQIDSDWDIRIPLRKKVLDRLYELSPSLKQLKPYLDKSSWHLIANERFPTEVLKKDPRLAENTKGGFIQWELLDAMESAGYFRKGSWGKTKFFMRQVVSDFQKASAEGKLPGFRPRCTNLTPFSDQMVKWFFKKLSWDAKYLFCWGKYLIFPPRLIMVNNTSPKIRCYYAALKCNELSAVEHYKISGWGVLPMEKKLVRQQNFAESPIIFFQTVPRKDVQDHLTKAGYPDIPRDAGFSFYLRGRHLKAVNHRGTPIFSGDVLKTRKSQNLFLDEVTPIKSVAIIRWKRNILYQITMFCRKNGLYITLLCAFFVILGIVYGIFHPEAWRTITDLFFSGFLVWGTGFIYFCLIIFANVMLHCPRNAGYYMPAFALIYSACVLFIIAGFSILCSKRKAEPSKSIETAKADIQHIEF